MYKEKALQLANKMYNGDVFTKTKQEHLDELENAKRCSIIAIEELINATQYKCHIHYAHNDIETVEFWEEVKKEIDNL